MLIWYEVYVYAIETYQKISRFLQFLNYGIFSYTNFAANMNVSLTSNRFLPYFEKILVNASSLQNFEGLFLKSLKKKLCALESSKMHTKCEKSQNDILLFLLIQVERNVYISKILVYCRLKCSF